MMYLPAIMLVSLLTATSLAEDATPTMTVSGQATLHVPADQFSISLGVTHTETTVEDARSKVDERVAAILKVLDGLGLDRTSDWKTGRYSIDPQWTPRPRSLSREQADTWTPSIVGYKVAASITVTTGRLDLAPAIVAGAAKAGANDIGALSFSLKDPRTGRAETIRQAAHNAFMDGHVLAEASGVVLVRTVTLNLDNASARPPRPINYKAGTAMARSAAFDAESLPDISGGMVTVTADVTAVWEIAPAGDDHHHGHKD